MPFPTSPDRSHAGQDRGPALEAETLTKLVLLARGFRGRLDEHLRKIGHSAAQMDTLTAILEDQGEKSQSDIASSLGVEGATITRMIDILAKEGLVERTAHPTDRRINLLRITPAGELAVRDIHRIYGRLRKHLLANISQAELETLNALVNKMMNQLTTQAESEIQITDMSQLDRLRDRLLDDPQSDAMSDKHK